jgi:hypothetical protein
MSSEIALAHATVKETQRPPGVPSLSDQLPKEGGRVSAGIDFTADIVSIRVGLRSSAGERLAERFGDSRFGLMDGLSAPTNPMAGTAAGAGEPAAGAYNSRGIMAQ